MKRLFVLLPLLILALPANAQRLLAEDTSRLVRICGVVAVGDGFTPVTTLDLSTADEAEVLREGTATLDISGATFAAITGADGCYSLTLDTTATSTVGELIVAINDDSLILPVWEVFQVVEEAVYAACCEAASTPLTAVAVRTEMDSNSTQLAAIEGQTDDIGAAGAGLTAADDAVIAILGTPADTDIATDIANAHTDVLANRTQIFIGTADSGDANTLVDAALGAAFTNDEDIDGAYVVRADGQRCFIDSFTQATDTVEFGACAFTGDWSTQAYDIYPANTQ